MVDVPFDFWRPEALNQNMPVIRSLSADDSKAIIKLSDQEIGEGFYTESNLSPILNRSLKAQASFVLIDESSELKGFRLTYPPGHWIDSFEAPLLADRWDVPQEEVAYFKTIVVDRNCRGGGWAKKMSLQSMESLRQQSAKAVVCHCWKESPDGASEKYLTSLGFQIIGEHSNFWQEIDYECVVCLPKKCHCTAYEMILYL